MSQFEVIALDQRLVRASAVALGGAALSASVGAREIHIDGHSRSSASIWRRCQRRFLCAGLFV